MWHTLNDNSAAIQGLSAVLNVLITLTLAVLTWRYVKLTSRLLEVAQDQADHAISVKGDEKQRTCYLAVTYLGRFKKFIDKLPSKDRDMDDLEAAGTFSSADFDGFQSAVLSVTPTSAHVIGEVVDRLRWLSDRCQEAKANPQTISTINMQEYFANIQVAKDGLGTISLALHKFSN